MNQTSTPIYNTPSHEPELRDVFELYKRSAMLGTNCHAIGTINSFTPNDMNLTPPRPTVTVLLNYPRTVFYPDTDNAQQVIPKTIPYPLLVSVPVVILSGGGGGQQGHQVLLSHYSWRSGLVLFNDRSLDNWKNGSSSSGTPLNSSRLHHLSDGMALIGFPIFPSTSGNTPAYSQNYALLSNGEAQVGVGNKKVLITNDPDQVNNLNSLLQQLVTGIKGLTVTTSASSGTWSVTDTTGNVSAAATALGKLLE